MRRMFERGRCAETITHAAPALDALLPEYRVAATRADLVIEAPRGREDDARAAALLEGWRLAGGLVLERGGWRRGSQRARARRGVSVRETVAIQVRFEEVGGRGRASAS